MAAPKKKPLTVGKGTSYTRPKADGKAPRPVSAKPSAASKVRAAKKTTSSGITRTPAGRPQSEGRAGRQAVSQAKITSSRPSGARSLRTNMRPPVTSDATRSSTGSAKVTTGAGKDAMDVARARGKAEVAKAQARRNAKAASQRMAGKLAKAGAMRALGAAGKLAGRAATFYQGIQANNTATGTLSEAKKKYGAKAMPQKQGPAAPKTTQASFNKKTFDQAFKAARISGAKQFTWRGKKYTTKMKGE